MIEQKELVECVYQQNYDRKLLDNMTKSWSIKTGVDIRQLNGNAFSVSSAAIVLGKDNNTMISLGRENTIQVWSLKWGAKIGILKGRKDMINVVAIGIDNDTVIAGGQDGTLRVWSIQREICIRAFEGLHGAINSLAIGNDNDTVISGGTDGSLRVWSINSGACIRTFERLDTINSVAIGTDNDTVLTGGGWTVARWSIKQNKCIKNFNFGSRNVNMVVLGLDNETMVASSNHTVKIWSIKKGSWWTGYYLRGFECKYSVNSIALNVDSDTIICGGGGIVSIQSIKSGRCLKELGFHNMSEFVVKAVIPVTINHKLYVIVGLKQGNLGFQFACEIPDFKPKAGSVITSAIVKANVNKTENSIAIPLDPSQQWDAIALEGTRQKVKTSSQIFIPTDEPLSISLETIIEEKTHLINSLCRMIAEYHQDPFEDIHFPGVPEHFLISYQQLQQERKDLQERSRQESEVATISQRVNAIKDLNIFNGHLCEISEIIVSYEFEKNFLISYEIDKRNTAAHCEEYCRFKEERENRRQEEEEEWLRGEEEQWSKIISLGQRG